MFWARSHMWVMGYKKGAHLRELDETDIHMGCVLGSLWLNSFCHNLASCLFICLFIKDLLICLNGRVK